MPDNLIITREELEEFKKIARKEYGVELTDEQAYEQGSALVTLLETVIKKEIANRKEKRLTLLRKDLG